jgi:hypothetical protein
MSSFRGFKYTPFYDAREYKYLPSEGKEDAFFNLEKLKQNNPADYYDEAAHYVSSLAFKNWAMNRNGYNQPLYDALEVIKEKNPAAYYKEQIKLLGRQAGWLYGQNDPKGAQTYTAQAQNIVADSGKYGISPEQVNSLFNQNVALSSEQNRSVIAGKAADAKNFGLEGTIRGILPVAALALGGPLLDAALSAGTAASTASGAGGSYGGINLGGAFTPTAGSGASFALPATSGLMGPTYAELGITGVEGGLAGPTYGELGYTGLNNAEAIAAADSASQMSGLRNGLSSAKDVYSNANRAKKLAEMLNPASRNVSQQQQQLLQMQQANQPMQEQFGGLYRMNQNPFAQTQQAASIQQPFGKTQDFLSQLAEEGKTQPNLADLLRNA